MSEPTQVWIVRTKMGFCYVGVETESEACRIIAERQHGEEIIGAKRVRNVDHVKQGEFRPVPIGDYSGPLIPD